MDDSKEILAHRFAWILANGPIPENLQVLHRCDNPPCVNPFHLFLGDNQTNVDDKVAKNRQAKILPINTVRTIKQRWIASEGLLNQTALARQYKVSQGTIWNIISGRTWKHVKV